MDDGRTAPHRSGGGKGTGSVRVALAAFYVPLVRDQYHDKGGRGGTCWSCSARATRT